MSRSRWDYALLLAALAAGGWLRFFQLGKHALWLDEATTAAFAQRSFEAMFFAETQHPPLYNLLVWIWVRVCGNSDAGVRVLPAVFGTFTILAMWLLARRLIAPGARNSKLETRNSADVLNQERFSSFDCRVSIYAAWLAALSPFLIFFSQENRSYALLILLAVLSTWAFLRWQHSGRGLWLYATLCALLLYTHYFGAFVLLAHEIVFWRAVGFQGLKPLKEVKWVREAAGLKPRPADRPTLFQWVASRCVVLVAFWPWVVWVAMNFVPQARDWVGAPLPRIPYALIRYLLGYGVIARDLRTTPLEEIVRLELAYVLPIFVLLVWLVWRGWRSLKERNSKLEIRNSVNQPEAGRISSFDFRFSDTRWLLGAVVILPFAILLPISPWMRLIHERYLSFQAPFVLLLIAFGLASLRRPARIAAGGATLASLAFVLAAYFGAPGHLLGYELRFMKEDWRGAAAFVRESQPEVVIVAPHYICLPLDRYLPEKPGPRHIRMPDRLADVPAISPSVRRIALVIAREGPPQTKLREQMDARFRRVAERSFWSQNPIHVVVYERK